MRITLNYANAHLIYELQSSGIIDSIAHNWFDIVVARLYSGEDISIHLVERDIDVAEIRNILERNDKEGKYTLFILWCAMLLPEHGEVYPPYDWMSALLELYGDKIYAYEADGPRVWLFPVHFEPIPARYERLIRYGEVIEFGALRCDTIQTEASFINGRWRVVSFDQAFARATHDQEGKPRIRMHGSLRIYYDVLGVPYDADRETVRKAFRQLALQFHPDVNDAPDAAEKMRQINTAYRRIIDLLDESGAA